MDKNRILPIVQSAMQGNAAALEQLCAESAQTVLFMCQKLLPNHADAEDAAQEVLLKLYKNLHRLREAESFFAWLARVVSTTCANRRRAGARGAALLLEEQTAQDMPEYNLEFLPIEYAEQQEKRSLVLDALDTLPTKYRQVILLHYYQQLTPAEIAYALGTNPNHVRNLLYRGRNLLREAIESGKEEQDQYTLANYAGIPVLTLILRWQAKDTAPPALTALLLQKLVAQAAKQTLRHTAATRLFHAAGIAISGAALTTAVLVAVSTPYQGGSYPPVVSPSGAVPQQPAVYTPATGSSHNNPSSASSPPPTATPGGGSGGTEGNTPSTAQPGTTLPPAGLHSSAGGHTGQQNTQVEAEPSPPKTASSQTASSQSTFSQNASSQSEEADLATSQNGTSAPVFSSTPTAASGQSSVPAAQSTSSAVPASSLEAQSGTSAYSAAPSASTTSGSSSQAAAPQQYTLYGEVAFTTAEGTPVQGGEAYTEGHTVTLYEGDVAVATAQTMQGGMYTLQFAHAGGPLTLACEPETFTPLGTASIMPHSGTRLPTLYITDDTVPGAYILLHNAEAEPGGEYVNPTAAQLVYFDDTNCTVEGSITTQNGTELLLSNSSLIPLSGSNLPASADGAPFTVTFTVTDAAGNTTETQRDFLRLFEY